MTSVTPPAIALLQRDLPRVEAPDTRQSDPVDVLPSPVPQEPLQHPALTSTEVLPCTSDPDLFHPEFYPDEDALDLSADDPDLAQIKQAKALCWLCPERVGCLVWAMKHAPDGIWGATTPRERGWDPEAAEAFGGAA